MITKAEFEKLIELKFIALVRVVTVPQENTWCIDVILRRPLRAGYKVETIVAGRDANTLQIDRFESLDSACLLYTSPSPRDRQKSRMPSSA